MTVQTPPWAIQGSSHPAEVGRNLTAAAFGVPVAAHTAAASVTTVGGGHGVVNSGDLAVTQNGTPNMSVNVAAGRALVRSGGTSSLLAGSYAFLNDATVNLAISASDPTNPRRDLVIAQVRDTNYGEAASDARLTVVTGTPAASPADPALTSYPNCVVLARVAVAAAATTVTNANITDLRTRAHALGGVGVGSSSQRPSGSSLYEGKVGIDTTNDRLLIVDGSSVEQRVGWYSSAGRLEGRWRRTTAQSIPNSVDTGISWGTKDVDTDSINATPGTTFTIPAGLGGIYLVSLSIAWSTSLAFRNFAGVAVTSSITGVTQPHRAQGYGDSNILLTLCTPLAAGDTFVATAFQASGSAQNLSQAWINVVRIAL